MEEDNVDNEPEINENAIEIPEDDEPISKVERVKFFLMTYWRGLVCLLAPILLFPLLAPFPSEKYQWCAYTLVLMGVYWVSECIPLAVTSFLPILIFPLAGVMDTTTTCLCYINNTIVMFLGSMALAYAIEQSGLHKRIALFSIRTIGYSHNRLLFAMSFTTMFISMWVSNTAATTMMVPINLALLKVFEDQNLLKIYETGAEGEDVASDITVCYFCASTFSATVGGIGTLVGTATNLVFKGLFEKTFPDAPEYLSFPIFSAFSIPFMLLLEICIYLCLTVSSFGFLRPNSETAKKCKISDEGLEAAKRKVAEDWENLGRITFWEIIVAVLFVGAMVLMLCRSPQIFYGWSNMISDYFGLDNNSFVLDGAVVILVVVLMLTLPSTLDFFKHFTGKEGEVPDKPIPSVLSWTVTNNRMPYGFMFLLGGGFALSMAAKKEYSDLNGQIGILLKQLNTLPNFFIIFLIIVFTMFVTNFAANVAVANLIVPIVMQLALEVQIHPLWYNIAAGYSASFCFCLPVGTPGNLIAQSAAKMTTFQMVKTGAVPSVIGVVISWFCICFWAPVVWPVLHEPFDASLGIHK